MHLNKIFEKYNKIQSANSNCQEERDDEVSKLKEQIKIVFTDYTYEMRMEKFLELYEMHTLISSSKDEEYKVVNELNYDKYDMDPKYEEYLDKPFMEGDGVDKWPFAANLQLSQHKDTGPSDYDLASSFREIFDIAHKVDAKEVRESYKMIGDMLEALWECIFQKNLNYLQSSNDDLTTNTKVPCDKIHESYTKNWSLYALINRINIYLLKLEKEGKISNKKFSNMSENEKENIIYDTKDVCIYILECCVFGESQRKNTVSDTLPKLRISKDAQLHKVIATSDLVSYIFECKNMTVIKRNKYYADVERNIQQIYRKILKSVDIYEAMESYLKVNDSTYTVTYKNNSFYPKVVLLFVLSIMQEVIKKTLTQKEHNIFYKLKKTRRDEGMTEKYIMGRVKKDSKSYMLVYQYLDNPGRTTLQKKNIKLNAWILQLNKLRFGVLDDCLFDLAQNLGGSYKEETVTVFKMEPKKPRP